METTLADLVRDAVAKGRRLAAAFPDTIAKETAKDALPWQVIAAFDADIRGHVERDPRIEDARDRVLIAAVKLAETPPDDGPDALDGARRHLVAALDDLERTVLGLGIVNRTAAKRGYGAAGARVGAPA